MSSSFRKRRLSTILTLPYKLFVLVFAGFGLYLLFFQFERTGWGLVIYSSAVVFAYFLVGTYKRVCVNDEALFVSNYVREIRFPFDEIENVKGPSWKTRTPEIV